MTKRQRAYIEYELEALRQHLVVANDPKKEEKLAVYRKEMEDAPPAVPNYFRIPKIKAYPGSEQYK